MPELDGLSVCREIRQLSERPYIYVVLLTSKEAKEDIVAGLESGADDYLTKPFNAAELRARLRTGERVLNLEDRLVEAREEMPFKATHDTLTSLWNRGAIMDLLGQEMARSRREGISTIMLLGDVDHFKTVNDTHGHLVGDEVLREVARRLLSYVRSYDFVGRYGGEEFLVVLNNCNPAFAENLHEFWAASERPLRNPPTGAVATRDRCRFVCGKAAVRNCVRTARPASQEAKPASGVGEPLERVR